MSLALEKSENHIKDLYKLEALDNLINITESKIAALEKKNDINSEMKRIELARLEKAKTVLINQRTAYKEEIDCISSSSKTIEQSKPIDSPLLK